MDCRSIFQNQHLRYSGLGILFGVAIFSPLVGRLWGLPSRLLVLVALGVAICIAFPTAQKLKRVSITDWVFIGIAVAELILVVMSAQSSQFVFLQNFASWLGHEADYYRSKLLLFLLTYVPSLALLFVAVAIPSSSRRAVSEGFMVGTVAMGVAALLRLWWHWQSIITNDDVVAWSFLVNPDLGFSTVSYSVLFGCAAVALQSLAMTRRWLAVLSAVAGGIFLWSIWVINQRADIVFATFAIVCLAAVSIYVARDTARSRRIGLTAFATLSVAVVSIVIAMNPVQKAYWADLAAGKDSRGVSLRIDAMVTAVNQIYSPDISVSPQDALPSQQTRGLGSFAVADPVMKYPHNLLIELWIECGILAALLFIVMMLLSGVRILRRRLPDDALITYGLAAIAAIMILHSLKAGEITSLGVIVFVLWLAGCNPAVADRNN